jgi:hypothetical protein
MTPTISVVSAIANADAALRAITTVVSLATSSVIFHLPSHDETERPSVTDPRGSTVKIVHERRMCR